MQGLFAFYSFFWPVFSSLDYGILLMCFRIEKTIHIEAVVGVSRGGRMRFGKCSAWGQKIYLGWRFPWRWLCGRGKQCLFSRTCLSASGPVAFSLGRPKLLFCGCRPINFNGPGRNYYFRYYIFNRILNNGTKWRDTVFHQSFYSVLFCCFMRLHDFVL